MIEQIRNYVFVPSGEAIRGLEVAIGTAIVEQLSGVSDLTSWRTYLVAVITAAAVAGIAYIKGRLPAKY